MKRRLGRGAMRGLAPIQRRLWQWREGCNTALCHDMQHVQTWGWQDQKEEVAHARKGISQASMLARLAMRRNMSG